MLLKYYIITYFFLKHYLDIKLLCFLQDYLPFLFFLILILFIFFLFKFLGKLIFVLLDLVDLKPEHNYLNKLLETDSTILLFIINNFLIIYIIFFFVLRNEIVENLFSLIFFFFFFINLIIFFYLYISHIKKNIKMEITIKKLIIILKKNFLSKYNKNKIDGLLYMRQETLEIQKKCTFLKKKVYNNKNFISNLKKRYRWEKIKYYFYFIKNMKMSRNCIKLFLKKIFYIFKFIKNISNKFKIIYYIINVPTLLSINIFHLLFSVFLFVEFSNFFEIPNMITYFLKSLEKYLQIFADSGDALEKLPTNSDDALEERKKKTSWKKWLLYTAIGITTIIAVYFLINGGTFSGNHLPSQEQNVEGNSSTKILAGAGGIALGISSSNNDNATLDVDVDQEKSEGLEKNSKDFLDQKNAFISKHIFGPFGPLIKDKYNLDFLENKDIIEEQIVFGERVDNSLFKLDKNPVSEPISKLSNSITMEEDTPQKKLYPHLYRPQNLMGPYSSMMDPNYKKYDVPFLTEYYLDQDKKARLLDFSEENKGDRISGSDVFVSPQRGKIFNISDINLEPSICDGKLHNEIILNHFKTDGLIHKEFIQTINDSAEVLSNGDTRVDFRKMFLMDDKFKIFFLKNIETNKSTINLVEKITPGSFRLIENNVVFQLVEAPDCNKYLCYIKTKNNEIFRFDPKNLEIFKEYSKTEK